MRSCPSFNHGSVQTRRDLLETIRGALAGPGAILLRNCPTQDPSQWLEALGSALGAISSEDVAVPERERLHRVEALLSPLQDSRGREILSTSNKEFPYHTDEFFNREPADIVVQYCVRPASCGGGRTLLATFADIIERLAPDTARLLHEPRFPAPFGPAPILLGNAGSSPCGRFNIGELWNEPLSTEERRAIEEFEITARAVKQEFLMASGDCTIINNWAALHGRTAFIQESGRLILRMRIHCPSLKPSLQGCG